MGGDSGALNGRIKDRVNPPRPRQQVETSATSCGSDEETRMYAKLILSKVNKLEVEVAALSVECSEHGSTSGVVELDAEEGEIGGGGGNHARGHKRGDHDDPSGFKKEMERNCVRLHGEVVTVRKLAEVLVDHVMEPGSESETASSSNPLQARSGTGSNADETRMFVKLILSKVMKLEVEVAALSLKCCEPCLGPASVKVELVDLKAEEQENAGNGNGNHNRGQDYGNIDFSLFKKEMEDNYGRIHMEVVTLRKLAEVLIVHVMETGSESKSSTRDAGDDAKELNEDGTCTGASKERTTWINSGVTPKQESVTKEEPVSPPPNIPTSPVSSEGTTPLSSSPASTESTFKRPHSMEEAYPALQTSQAASVPKTLTTSTSGQSLSVAGISPNSVNAVVPMAPSELAEWRKQEVEKGLEAIKRAKLDKLATKEQELIHKGIEDSVQVAEKTKPRDTRDITVDTKDEKKKEHHKSKESRSSSSHHHHHRDKDRRSHRDKDKTKDQDKKLGSRDRDRDMDHKIGRDKDKDKHRHSDRNRDDKDKKSENERHRSSSSSGHKSSHHLDRKKERSHRERDRRKSQEKRSDRHKENDKDKVKYHKEKESKSNKDRSSKQAKDSEKEKDRHGDKGGGKLSGDSQRRKPVSAEKEDTEMKGNTTEKMKIGTITEVQVKEEKIVESGSTATASSSHSTLSPTVSSTATPSASAGEVKIKHDASLDSEQGLPPSTIKAPDFAEDSSPTSAGEKEGQQKPLFQATLEMPALGEFKASFFNVSHNDNSSSGPYFPDSPVPVIGRIDHDTVWGYIEALKKSKPKEIFTFRLSPAAVADSKGYMTYFKYLSSRGRLGVIGGMCPPLRDAFLLPLEKEQPIPEILQPFSGPGLPKEKLSHCLLAIVIRHVDVVAGGLKRKISAVGAEASASEKKTKIGVDRDKDSAKMGGQSQMETGSDKTNDNEPYTPLEDDEETSQENDKVPDTPRQEEVTSFLGSSTLAMSKPRVTVVSQSEIQGLGSLDPRSTGDAISKNQSQPTPSSPQQSTIQAQTQTSPRHWPGSSPQPLLLDDSLPENASTVKKAQVASGRPKHGLSSSPFGDARDAKEEQGLTEAVQRTVTVEDRTYTTGAAMARRIIRNKSLRGTVQQAAVQKAIQPRSSSTRVRKVTARLMDEPLPTKKSTTQIKPQSISAIDSASSSSSIGPPVGGSVSGTENGIGETQDELEKTTQAETCASASAQSQPQTSALSGQRTQPRKEDLGLNLKCIFCQEKFASKKLLTDHISSHTNERQYNCGLCPYECDNKSTLKRHLETHNSDRERKFQCELCSKGFFTMWELKRHTLIHKGTKEFKCDVCHKSFKMKCTLQRHKMVHTSGKEHCCGICDRKFSRKDSLEFHMRRSHTRSGMFAENLPNPAMVELITGGGIIISDQLKL